MIKLLLKHKIIDTCINTAFDGIFKNFDIVELQWIRGCDITDAHLGMHVHKIVNHDDDDRNNAGGIKNIRIILPVSILTREGFGGYNTFPYNQSYVIANFVFWDSDYLLVGTHIHN